MSKSGKHKPARQRRGHAEEVECIRNGEVDPSAALTSGIHLLVLFLNLIHLAAQRTSIACWKGLIFLMDAIVRNAKVNMRHSRKKNPQKTLWKCRCLSYFKSDSFVSSSQQSDLASHCNNIQTEDNCWVHAHVLELICKTGHGMAHVTHDSMQAYHLGWDSKMELSDVNAGGQFCLDLSVLTEGPLFATACQEQLSDMKAHQCVNRFRVMKCQFWQMTNNKGECVA